MATPDGILLVFFLYEGRRNDIMPEKVHMPEKLDIGGRVVLKVADILPSQSLFLWMGFSRLFHY